MLTCVFYSKLLCEKSDDEINEELLISLSSVYFPNKHVEVKMPQGLLVANFHALLLTIHCLTKLTNDQQRHLYNILFPVSEYLRLFATNKFRSLSPIPE